MYLSKTTIKSNIGDTVKIPVRPNRNVSFPDTPFLYDHIWLMWSSSVAGMYCKAGSGISGLDYPADTDFVNICRIFIGFMAIFHYGMVSHWLT